MIPIFFDTLSELLSRKVLYLFAFVTLLMLGLVYLTGEIGGDITGPSGSEVQMEALLGPMAPWIAEVFSRVMTVLMFLAVLASVGLIPAAMEKGRAEFYLCRPISRATYLVGKLASIWIIYGAVALLSGMITYGVTAAVHGIFDGRIVLLFAVYWIDFAIWLCIVGFAGVISGSTVWAMTAAFGIWIAQWLLSFHEGIASLISSKIIGNLIELLYYIVPKTGEIGGVAVSLAIGQGSTDWMPLWSSLLFAAALLLLALWAFRRHDY